MTFKNTNDALDPPVYWIDPDPECKLYKGEGLINSGHQPLSFNGTIWVKCLCTSPNYPEVKKYTCK